MSDLIKFYLKKPLAGMNYATLGVIKPISRPSPQSRDKYETRSKFQLQISFVEYLPSHPMIGLRGQSNKLLLPRPRLAHYSGQ